ncbi:multidrug effflux MFS transporter [Breoghania sp. L-A4]|uniref:multidrug effflux MFS transporter n=1 Tax=Breoghania sp. L-A4 TaxID=2304600 RepID=UPI000E358D9F|nr:multidrug effflux MFS transporter [Breoghania sp. L-A4]AXS41439.1 Bcr/CflA family efflux MFS transporter [Breoghania sp. L-A4]
MSRTTVADAGSHPGLSFVEFVAIIAALMALNALAIDAMLPALPNIARDFGGISVNESQTVLTAYLLGFGGAQLVFGPLSDRFGRRTFILIGLAIYAAASVASVFVTTFDGLLLCRLLQGIGCAAPRVVAISVIRDCYGGRQMARVMSLAMMVFIIVPVIGPGIGQAVILMAPWRWIFGLLTFGGVSMLVWTSLRLPETLDVDKRRPLSVRTVAASYAEALTTRVSLGYMLGATLLFGGMFGFLNSAQQIFVDTYDTGNAFPLVFALVALAVAASSFMNAKLVGRLGMRPLSHWALLALIAAFAVHGGLAYAHLDTVYSFVVLMGIGMFCFGILMANFNALAMEPLGHIAGTASAAIGFVSTTGGALIGYMIGQAYDGSVLPLMIGFGGTGLIALVVVLITESGKLFQHGEAAPEHP